MARTSTRRALNEVAEMGEASDSLPVAFRGEPVSIGAPDPPAPERVAAERDTLYVSPDSSE